MSDVRTQAVAAIKSDTSKSQISDDHFGGRNGGNVFYEKRPSERVTQSTPLPQIKGMTGRQGHRKCNLRFITHANVRVLN
jgi:hypothetical protein